MRYPQRHLRTRGASIVFLVICLVILMGFGSFAVDLGTVMVAKTQLRSAADAACRAAVYGFGTSVAQAQANAISIASKNTCAGSPVSMSNSDVEFGTWDDVHKTFSPLSGAAQATATALRITASRTAAKGNAIPLLFAAIIGKSSFDVTAQAIAHTSTAGFSIVGLNSLTISKSVGGNSGNPPKMDSWNSAAGPYVSYPMNSNGNCASNGTISFPTNGSIVKGNCRPGNGKSITGSGYTISGITTPMTYTLNYPAPNPGSYATTNDNANLIALGNNYFNTSTRDFTIGNKTLTIPGGVYYINNLSWNTPHITFSGPVIFYVTGTTFFAHNSYITTYQSLPANLKFEITTAATVTYDFDQACYAVLYAPLATVTTTGLADDYGAVVGYNLTMGVGWHVDEALSGAGVMGVISYVQ